jgi:hypothetical protein
VEASVTGWVEVWVGGSEGSVGVTAFGDCLPQAADSSKATIIRITTNFFMKVPPFTKKTT